MQLWRGGAVDQAKASCSASMSVIMWSDEVQPSHNLPFFGLKYIHFFDVTLAPRTTR